MCGRELDHKIPLFLKYGRLNEVTISACTETHCTESSITVPLQQLYIGRKPVISASLANTPCTSFGVWRIIDQLNTILGTAYTRTEYPLVSIIEECHRNNYDFGTVYGHVHREWSGALEELHKRKKKHQEMREQALHENQIISPHLFPRNVWDLYSNRVVPKWVTVEPASPISHAWVDDKDRMNILTPINGYQWPVPIPKDTNLDLIRIELLNLGLEYV